MGRVDKSELFGLENKIVILRHVLTMAGAISVGAFGMGVTYSVLASDLDKVTERSQSNVTAISGLQEVVNDLTINQRLLQRDAARDRQDSIQFREETKDELKATNNNLRGILNELKEMNRSRFGGKQ